MKNSTTMDTTIKCSFNFQLLTSRVVARVESPIKKYDKHSTEEQILLKKMLTLVLPSTFIDMH